MELTNVPATLGRLTTAIGLAGGEIGDMTVIAIGLATVIREVDFKARDTVHVNQIIDEIRAVEGIRIIEVVDRTFAMHRQGKIAVTSKVKVDSPDDLAMAYTPGVGRICMEIFENPALAYDLTIKQNAVAIVTDGTAVLGLGDIGPLAAMPVMEGKALLFQQFAGISAFPVCLDTKDVDKIVATVKAISPVFGGINLEDISAPRCFEIEERCQQELEIPIFHDDQHGTAVVVLAALLNALKLVNKNLRDVRIVMLGSGASATATAKLLMRAGAQNIVSCDRAGALYRGRTENMNPTKKWFSENSNPDGLRGGITDVLQGADVFIGLSGPDLVRSDDLAGMSRDSIVFAMANPVPEITPEAAAQHARVIATGRSDYPNQINNSACFPGFFKGLLAVRARQVNDEMKLAAAYALSSLVGDDELTEQYITPSMFDPRIVPTVAAAVAQSALISGVAEEPVS
jgi:malate dehydrogenase (oxaloacetate-decarboxylating)